MTYSYVITLAHVPVLATVLSFSLLYRKLGNALKAFSWFVFLSGVIQLTSLFFWYRGKNNLLLLHIYSAVGFVALAWFYRVVLGNYIRPHVIWSVAVLFVLFCIVNAVFLQPISVFNSYVLIAEAVLVVILSLFTFVYLLNSSMREHGMPDITSISWINSGLFIYFLSCFLIYYFGNIITTHFTLASRQFTWIFHSFFSVVMYSCFLTGLWKRSKTAS